ncbi:hypothetical protein [Streptomyces sp. NPDC057718]|uniref:hypothetical protein n=1 Tax=Streptomyces sp. NPDC057718 TaxID=3346225 RepID=UPI0036A393B5
MCSFRAPAGAEVSSEHRALGGILWLWQVLGEEVVDLVEGDQVQAVVQTDVACAGDYEDFLGSPIFSTAYSVNQRGNVWSSTIMMTGHGLMS